MFDLIISIPDGVFVSDYIAEERAKRRVLMRTHRKPRSLSTLMHGDTMPWQVRDKTCAMFGEGVIELQSVL